MTKELVMGNAAFAHAALEAGVNVVAGYPGTPSTELIETVASMHAQGRATGVHVEWSTNEKTALELLAGASYCGARTLFTCKQVGLNVASDPLLSLNYVGVQGGTVLFVADDPGPISSQTEQDTRRFAMFAKLPVLDPATPDQGAEMMKAAFDLSERYRTPVIVRPTTRVCHASTYLEVPECTQGKQGDFAFDKDPKWVIFPARVYEGHGEINQRLADIARDFSHDKTLSAFNPITEGPEDPYKPYIGIMAGGVSTTYAQEALGLLYQQMQGKRDFLPDYRFMQVGTPYPFPEEAVAQFLDGLDEVLVIEELDNVLEDQLLSYVGSHHLRVNVRGKLTGDVPTRGENSVDSCMASLSRFFGLDSIIGPLPTTVYQQGSENALPVRPPVLCSGCPHRGSFYAIKKALGKTPAVLCGDIGCYTLGNAAPLDAVDSCLCMGASIAMSQGFHIAETELAQTGAGEDKPDKKHIAFVGDSTFFASGLTGLVNAVYNCHDVTIVVLDNSTTAMTGGQPHPGTGATLMGDKHEGVSIAGILKAIGFKCVLQANPLNNKAAVAAAAKALAYEGPSAVIFKSPCIQLIKPTPAFSVDTEKCTGCKRCIREIGCPAIGFNPDAQGPQSGTRGMAFVDTGQCYGCGLCSQLCPSSALRVPAHEQEGELDQVVAGGCGPRVKGGRRD